MLFMLEVIKCGSAPAQLISADHFFNLCVILELLLFYFVAYVLNPSDLTSRTDDSFLSSLVVLVGFKKKNLTSEWLLYVVD